jgi:TDG/mug DNA glycosylase family protein
MIHYQYKNSDLLFVGINPHHGSFDRGIPFSNNKLFWYLLSRANLIDETIEDLRDDATLRQIYRNKFNKVYKLGLINIIDRPTRDITLLKKGEEKEGKIKRSFVSLARFPMKNILDQRILHSAGKTTFISQRPLSCISHCEEKQL